MISPRSAELNQMHFNQSQQLPQQQQAANHNQILLPHHNGFYNYNNYSNYNNYNNYTASQNTTQSNSSSFSLPSAQQTPLYLEQQQQQQQQQQQPQQQQIGGAGTAGDERYAQRPVYFYAQPPHQLQQQQQPQQQPQYPPYIPQQVPQHQQEYSNHIIDPQQHQQQALPQQQQQQQQQPQPQAQLQPQLQDQQPQQHLQGTILPGPPGQLLHHSGIPPIAHPLSTTTPSNSLLHNSITANTSQEEAPFPGVLEPQYRSNSHAHPRSQTYPSEADMIKQKRMSSTSSSSSVTLLGMTPETARRNRCNICQKQFKRPSSLQTHLYSHTGEKPFACTWERCGRLFSVRSNMIRHRKLHERDAKLKDDSPSDSQLGQTEDVITSTLKHSDSNNEENNNPLTGQRGNLSVSSEDLKNGGNGSLSEKVRTNDESHTTTQLAHPTNHTTSNEFQLGW